jgi:hypothetical protein
MIGIIVSTVVVTIFLLALYNGWKDERAHKETKSEKLAREKIVKENLEEFERKFGDMDNDRYAAYFMERRGVYYRLGIKGSYLQDYIWGKISKEEFEKKCDEELKQSDKERQELRKKRENYMSETGQKVLEKKKELEKIKRDYEDIKDEYDNIDKFSSYDFLKVQLDEIEDDSDN